MSDLNFCQNLIGKEVEVLTNMTPRNMGHLDYLEPGEDPDDPYIDVGILCDVDAELTIKLADAHGISTIPKSYWDAIAPVAQSV